MSIFRIPLHNARVREVLARVAYRVLERRLRSASSQEVYQLIQPGLDGIAGELLIEGFGVLCPWINSYTLALRSRQQPRYQLAAYCDEYRRGALEERRRLHPGYKQGRWSSTPRVTNRGGQTYDCWKDPLNNATLPDDLARSGEDGNQGRD